ncbi:PREDICTED: transformation/transcription domain-associated protein-like [Priapulus caudatus]|uniref:Transformation/transcription domain-associated protein-like n=1 Tax=Priapulus caudatus TaxID=37621 RepID=A0ABM1F9N9_PRICU|nr:PREDICTED: transformation/transcription domain-associated protein-like [Priapulus caudatus]
MDSLTQINTYHSFVKMVGDQTAKENRLKAAQEISENLEAIIVSPHYPSFLEHMIKTFLKVLQEEDPQFISEFNIQQLRKLTLEVIHRMPTNEHLRPFVKQVLSAMFKLIQVENEENVLVCLRIIIELLKQYRPQFAPEIQTFLAFVKSIYKEFPNHVAAIFEPKSPIKVADILDISIETLLTETFTMTTVQTEKKNADGTPTAYNLIPKAVCSLKVMAELPIIVVLMYQLYKQNVQQDVAEFVPLIMMTIILQPAPQHRVNPAFNKELFVDFIAAQIKTLSFLAYIIKSYQDVVGQHAAHLVKGMLSLLSLCPHEVAHLRKELLIAARHILATHLRVRFVQHIDRLFDENVLIGGGWTAHESLRPLAYSTLADLVHHVRNHLSLTDLGLAVHLFSKNVHDDSLPSSIQAMSCKLLLNLVECIKQKSEQESGNGRELLIRMLEVFVLKFKVIAKVHLPLILQKCKPTSAQPPPAMQVGGLGQHTGSQTSIGSKPPTPTAPLTPTPQLLVGLQPAATAVPTATPPEEKFKILDKDKDEKQRFGMSPLNILSVPDCRSLVKTLVCGVKTITWGTASCKGSNDAAFVQSKHFQSKETLVFIRLVKYALASLDIYTINYSASGQMSLRTPQQQSVRSKEEKEVLEHFAGVFTMMNPQTFREIFATTIQFTVERIYKNYTLQIVANSFLANPTTSATFATILVEYLLERLEDMGSSIEKSNLYLKLFKLVFGSVSLFADENEQMLKPHLHRIVKRSMELAMRAQEPYNYFLLLRALFRSIGGGSHDLLYKEFLPLLPSLLQGLNSLQSGLHKQHMKDLYVELCFTVPVRLSSLLPYLPMLMDPLVSALNGSQTLVSQGLRTLELCVDNLQPDFLYDHIQPVRAELMQALWKTLRNPNDSIANVAFRVLGKFGGGNRKMLNEPQRLQYNDKETPGPCVTVYFQEMKTPITLPVERAIAAALSALKSGTTESYYRKQSWEVIKCFLVSAINLDDEKHTLQQLFSHPSFVEREIAPIQPPAYKCADWEARGVHVQALTGLFVAAAIKELRSAVLPTMASLVRHYTMVAISQQCGPFPMNERQHKLQGMDCCVLIDALAIIMGHEEKELCKPGHLALVLIMDIASTLLGSKERACQLPLFDYLVEKMCALCYDRAWYAKMGGCIAIKFLFEHMPLKWVLDHQFVFLKALLFVMMDLTNEVSSGAVDMAKSNLEKLLMECSASIESQDGAEELIAAQKKSFHSVTHELVRQVTSPNATVREQAMHSLQVLAKTVAKSVTEIMEPHKEVLVDMIPPKKHLLRHQPANAQIGLMDGNTFCTTLEPRLFTMDLGVVEHKVFFTELVSLCEADDAVLLKLPCYKSVTNLVPLRKSALCALAACHYITACQDKIFGLLYKALNSTNSELQEAGYECMNKFLAGCQIDMEIVHSAMRPLLLMLGDYRSLSLNVIQRLSYLTQLFPNTFHEKLCDQLLCHLNKWLDAAIAAQKSASAAAKNSGAELSTCVAIIDIFHQVPAASAKFVEQLTPLVLKAEKTLLVEAGSPFREPLMRFLLRFPQQTVDMFLAESNVKDQQFTRYFRYLIRRDTGEPFRAVLKSNPNRLIAMAFGTIQVQGQMVQPSSPSGTGTTKHELEFQAVHITSIIVNFDDKWLSSQTQLVATFRKIWIADAFQDRHRKLDGVDFAHWSGAKLIVKCLLNYCKHHPNDVELLYQLLRALTGRFIPHFQELREYLETKVAHDYPVEWKRKAFFKFVEIFHDQNFPQTLKAKILQCVIIPTFQSAFERGDGERLIGGPPAPDQDSNDNVVSVFINRIIDPEKPFGTSDAVRILLLQFSCLLVEHASPHIHDSANKKQGNKLRRLMTFAWPCLLSKNCVDPTTKYHGHLLLAHIIAKFAIHKRIVLQVFHSLLKAHAVEARLVVRQALEILTPAMPARMEDGNGMLAHWTKKIIVEEGHILAQLVHILQLLVRHYKVYYPVRHHLIAHMVTSMQRLGFTTTAQIEHRKLAVELAEVVLKWELQRIKDEQESGGDTAIALADADLAVASPQTKRPASAELPEPKRARHSSSGTTLATGDGKPLDRAHCDTVVNFLIRMACHVNEAATAVGSPGELLSRRCVALLKMALRPDVWPSAELKLTWLDKLLLTATRGDADAPQPTNFANVCTGLEILAFLVGALANDAILTTFKPLQRGVSACMSCANTKVVRAVHSLLSRLMDKFPTESSTSSVASKHEELECLYACVSKVIYEGLAQYEKSASSSPSSLFGTLFILKAACFNNQCYIDRLITSFMRVLLKMTREHLCPSSSEANPATSELLILSLDLVKNRVGVMSSDMRKSFIGTILVGLLEKTPDMKVMRAITKMVEDWVKTKNPIHINQGPSLREKSILLVKMMQYIEKRFPDDLELNAQFLELINHVYRDDALRGTELHSKLEPAFLAGLRCPQAPIRAKFFDIFDRSIRRKPFDRLLYIVCSQNWEYMGPHYWIKQCVELLLAVAVTGTSMSGCLPAGQLPSVMSVMAFADGQERAEFTMMTKIKEEPMDVESVKEDEEIDIEIGGGADDGVAAGLGKDTAVKKDAHDPKQNLQLLLTRQAKFLEGLRDVKTVTFLSALAQLCHANTHLAHDVWLALLPRLWKVLSERQQQTLAAELQPFLCSGAHLIQKDCHPSAVNTFTEAVAACTPSVSIKPAVLKYLGKSHNLWHKVTLMLEQMSHEGGAGAGGGGGGGALRAGRAADCYEFEPVVTPQQEILDTLADMYEGLREEDMWAGLWQKRAKYTETNVAIAYEQHGFFEQAQTVYETAMAKARSDHNSQTASPALHSEYRLWEEHWIRAAKELNQWDLLLEYGNAKGHGNPLLILESAWRVPNWSLMKDALAQVELSYPKVLAYKVNMYRGYIAICHPEDHHLSIMDRVVELASSQAIKEWRRLPHVVASIHVPLLQAAQQIVELHEAAQINQGLQPANIGRTNSLHDMKSIVKTWRNRLPIISDDLSHWSDIFTWRQHHYQFIISHYDNHAQADPQTNHSMLGVHASAQAIINYGKVARKHNLTGVCLDSLSRIHTIPSVPIVDCFQKIRQQVMCYLQMAGAMGKAELQEGLEVIESTNLKYFTKDMTAEFYALKGMFLAQTGRSDEANKAFSAAVQMHDTLVRAWALWGDYLEQIFVKERATHLGVSAITCFLHACRHQNETKSRKYLAKVLWLLTYDDERSSLAEAVDKYCVGVPPVQWLPWIPQLLTCLVRNEGRLVLNLLSQVGRMYPQAVYFPIRTLYLTLKIEQRERYKSGGGEPAGGGDSKGTVTPTSLSAPVTPLGPGMPPAIATATATTTPVATTIDALSSTPAGALELGQGALSTPQGDGPLRNAGLEHQLGQPPLSAPQGEGPIRATAPMWRCSRIMHTQRDQHPTILSSLEGIVDQMVWFRENWYEEVLRQLRQGLAKCYAIAFENRGAVSEVAITPHTLNFIKKLVSTFGVGFENVSSVANTFSSAASESLARRAQATAQDPVFQKMKSQFTGDFDFAMPGAMKLHNLISKLKKWIKILEAKTRLLPKSFLIEEKCRFLSNFSQSTAEVELPGEFLLPKHSHYYIRIARFMPRVEIVQKHSSAARRLYVRGHNGKVYPYLIVNDAYLSDSRGEERVLQLMRMLNTFLNKQKETSRRLLNFTVPRAVAVSPQMRLVEDNPSSVSLSEIYRLCCARHGTDHDLPIARYYERLAAVQARGSQASHQVLRDILREVQTNVVPRGMLREWTCHAFPNATDYWTFRKFFTAQLALLGFAEFVLHLSRLNPDMLYVHQDSGFLNVAYFRFDVDDVSGDLDANRPVPFRLTPNVTEFLTPTGVAGPLTAAMVASARCLVQPQYKLASFLRAILRDEMIAWHKKKQEDTQPPGSQPQDMEGELLITMVNKAVGAINTRLQNLAAFEGAESRVSTLVAAANSHDNLCRMDPAWHPWL